jgi:5-methylcytosine-specific restriction endonuclease McrA
VDKYKTCSKCKETKSLCEFNKKAVRKDGHSSYCRECARVIRNKHPKKKTPYALLSEKEKQANRLYARKWNAANKDKRSLSTAMRRAAKKNNGIFTVAPSEIGKLQKNPCFYCGSPGGEIDHVIPLSKGGRHSIGNLVGCCRTCNSSKNNLFITQWNKKRPAHATYNVDGPRLF